MNALPGIANAEWFDSFGTRARPSAIAVFNGVDRSTRVSLEARVLADRPRWHTHGERGKSPFFTLGSPTYMREGAPTDSETQQYLFDHYPDAHLALIERLTSVLKAPVELSPDDSAPGFHIFESKAGTTHPALGMHLDVQYRHLDRQEPGNALENDVSRLLSITMVISADGDAGLDYVRGPHIPGLPMRTEPISHLKYEPGQLAIQFGLFPHSVAAFGSTESDQRRITLQAHAIQVGSGAWRLYW